MGNLRVGNYVIFRTFNGDAHYGHITEIDYNDDDVVIRCDDNVTRYATPRELQLATSR